MSAGKKAAHQISKKRGRNVLCIFADFPNLCYSPNMSMALGKTLKKKTKLSEVLTHMATAIFGLLCPKIPASNPLDNTCGSFKFN